MIGEVAVARWQRRRRPEVRRSGESEFFPGFADVEEIGFGSLAVVYRARELGTNRLVALKLLNVGDAAPRALESFERESVALGAVSSHPNIVTLYRTFRAADGRPVLVLELCAGSMGDRLQPGTALPPAEVVSLGIKVAGALETAHRAGILHRDVKPQNILITEFGEPALADFGVAVLQGSTQTTTGLFDFTTLHAAPELLEGGETSAATDVYELASTLYQLVAGRSAFRAFDGESPASVILRILRDPVQPLAGAGVPMSLSDLLLRAMSKEMHKRPPTAEEFARELVAIEEDEGWQPTRFVIRNAAGTPLPPLAPTRPELPAAAHPSPPVLPPVVAGFRAPPQRPAAGYTVAPPAAVAAPAAPAPPAVPVWNARRAAGGGDVAQSD
jgi:serine/threonine protein kinase